MKGKKQHDGSHDETTSIMQLMSIQPDFQDQETLLMFYGRQLGVIVDRTPKCHPELAGEGCCKAVLSKATAQRQKK